ncbi:MAG: hypothetical protein HOA63_04795 [Nitrosopumilus sp.]|jgi:flagellar motor component MotA|nr:hypothetical protein [Anaerolineae bacterium]MBT6839159.1 hypothetical protein [Nitrosopumilus sp.]MBT7071106.1 hypothetical protein [Anaerolineae bacterium]MBT7324852.1 hypothetical protein [Anaerolineae bacterium]
MDTNHIVGIIFAFLLIIIGVGTGIGLDFRKWWSWLIVFAGFLLGFIMSFSNKNEQSKISSGICLGSLISFVVFFSGWISWRQRKNIK